jgi:hypothetical protein
MSQFSTGASKIGPDVGKRSDGLFDPKKVYKFRHIQNAGLVRDRVDLEQKKKFGFPPGRLLTPRDRQWTGEELNAYYESRPVTQAEFKELSDHAPKSKVNTVRRKKAGAQIAPGRPRKGLHANFQSRGMSARPERRGLQPLR